MAKELGLDQVPTDCVSPLSKVQRRAFVLADNKCAEAGVWNQRKLALELETILSLDSSFEINATGFEIGGVDYHIE